MWQALTAEDMRSKGLGRRSFRLEEEWNAETLSRDFLHAPGDYNMRSTAKIHLIKSDKTVAELRDANIAQQNKSAKRDQELFKYFENALKAHGGPFASSARPVVAGLILDSAYSMEQDLILGHAALGCSNPGGVSLGMMGSHLAYSWPRFLEEVPACLMDTAIPGDTVGNDNGQCGSMWEACSIGQGAFLHEVGHAFGAPHTTGIMARGYAQDWSKNFLSETAYSSHTSTKGAMVIDGETNNDARWDLSDALSFKVQSHFRLPTDQPLSREVLAAVPSVQVLYEEEEAEFLRLVISCPAQIARLQFNGTTESTPTVAMPVSKVQFTMDELESRFDRSHPLILGVLGMNGKSRVVGNVWKLFSHISFVRIPGSSVILQKRSCLSERYQKVKEENLKSWDWAVMLQEKGADGKLTPATMIDSRVGCLLDGAVVYFKDGHKTPCGPRWTRGNQPHAFGGHAAQKVQIPQGVDVVKVEVGHNGRLNGLRFHLSDGTAGGYLYEDSSSQALEPAENEKIVGFYGRSDYRGGFCGIEEFGIITAPKDGELPDIVYDLPELQNTDGGTGTKGNCDDDESDGTADEMFEETDQEDEDEHMDE
ncbi:putative zinc metalloproteinase [Lachnellula subtilissima]|uniref:Putative zinc metalloproteinase n=1 Tax=Lachnellula subtilissima TaxID=602034 RepID=A0A8H8RSD5_9HELO|nr:putative zinc metalloproteinase [Lachnellula subtilissima]